MSRVTLTPKAKADLEDIWDFTFARWGLVQAEKYVRDLWSGMEKQVSDLAHSIDMLKNQQRPFLLDLCL